MGTGVINLKRLSAWQSHVGGHDDAGRVIPAKAGIQDDAGAYAGFSLDARLRGHDDEGRVIPAKAGIHDADGWVFTGCPPARA
jgi:hypothetical protein